MAQALGNSGGGGERSSSTMDSINEVAVRVSAGGAKESEALIKDVLQRAVASTKVLNNVVEVNAQDD
jgi:hypothetical protein